MVSGWFLFASLCLVLILALRLYLECYETSSWRKAWFEKHNQYADELAKRTQLETKAKSLQDRLDRINDITCEELSP